MAQHIRYPAHSKIQGFACFACNTAGKGGSDGTSQGLYLKLNDPGQYVVVTIDMSSSILTRDARMEVEVESAWWTSGSSCLCLFGGTGLHAACLKGCERQ